MIDIYRLHILDRGEMWRAPVPGPVPQELLLQTCPIGYGRPLFDYRAPGISPLTRSLAPGGMRGAIPFMDLDMARTGAVPKGWRPVNVRAAYPVIPVGGEARETAAPLKVKPAVITGASGGQIQQEGGEAAMETLV